MRVLICTILVAVMLAAAGTARAASGTISAEPNPCKVKAPRIHCTTFITWTTRDARHARVYVKAEGKQAAEEKEFANADSQKNAKADWIGEDTRYLFTLYDWSAGRKGEVLATVTVTGEK